MRRQVRPYTVSLLLALFWQRYPRSLMIPMLMCPRRLDIKAVMRYEQISGAKINFDKSEGLRLGAWRDGVPMPELFHWNDRPVRTLGVWFGPGLQLELNWSEVQAKVDVLVGTWLRRQLSLKGWAEVHAVYIFSLILCRLSVLPLPKNRRLANSE